MIKLEYSIIKICKYQENVRLKKKMLFVKLLDFINKGF